LVKAEAKAKAKAMAKVLIEEMQLGMVGAAI
jgi:type IV secretory pathway VirD2 relaxase